MLEQAPTDRNRRQIIAAILLTAFLASAVVAAFADNVLGILGLFAAPFWLPVCCYYVHLLAVKLYFGISLVSCLLIVPLAVVNELHPLPKGAVLVFAISSILMAAGSGLGLLVAYSREKQLRPMNR
jgi:hypothetical protein